MFTGNCEFLSSELVLFHRLEIKTVSRGAIERAGLDVEQMDWIRG